MKVFNLRNLLQIEDNEAGANPGASKLLVVGKGQRCERYLEEKCRSAWSSVPCSGADFPKGKGRSQKATKIRLWRERS